MAKSVTVINKDIANALRFHALNQPPEAIELVKLSEDIDNILKRPPNYLQSGPLLDEYYGKIIKVMSLLKQANQSSFAQKKNVNVENPTSAEIVQQPQNDDSSTSPVPDLINLSTPPHISSSSSSSLGASAAPISPQIAALSPIGTKLKRDLLTSVGYRDKNFVYDHAAKKLLIHGKNYEMSEFNDLYSKLRSPNKIKSTSLNPSQQELLDVITQTVENDPDGQKLISQLPRLTTTI
jgi:hypothetical protein